jgi:hypothetical protein
MKYRVDFRPQAGFGEDNLLKFWNPAYPSKAMDGFCFWTNVDLKRVFAQTLSACRDEKSPLVLR